MQNLTDHPSIEKYSEQFSDIIISDFFINKPTISGQDILDLTPVRQVNLFVIKSLLFQWKKESENLQSPYFDFSNEEVQKALTTFMNTVSRHISVDEESLRPLLVEAIHDSILLIFFPYVFYTNLINNWKEEKLLQKDLRQINKYIKVNEGLMASFINEMENRGVNSVNKTEALKILNDTMEQSDLSPDDTEEFEHKFDQVLPFRLNSFTKDEESHTPVVDIQEEVLNVAAEEDPDQITAWGEEEKNEEDSTEESNLDEAKKPLHETFQGEEKTTLADIHARQKIERISKYISINQKFMFINKLFDKDWGKFEKAISFLDETNDKNEIIQYLDEHAPAWREEGEESDEFRLVLEKKLGEPIE